MSRKVFAHQPRKVRRAPARATPLVATEDPSARGLRIEAERRERDRLEADRQARQAQRHAARRIAGDASDADAAWFRAHPGRNHYVRRYVAGEFPAPLGPWGWTVVKQVMPGFRLRRPFDVESGFARFRELSTSEYGAALLFETVGRGPVARLSEDVSQKAPLT
jgi:hypothetical protein